MKSIVYLLLCCLVHVSFAETQLSIGTESFKLEFESGTVSEQFLNFVADDVSRVFAPLQNVSNVLDIATVQTNPVACHALTFREWYPEGFVGGLSVTNLNGKPVFRMKASLSDRYMNFYSEFASISNKFCELESLMDSINDGSITNLTDSQSMSLIFIPEGSTYALTATEAKSFFSMLVRNRPISISILDYWTESIANVPCTVAASKTAIVVEGDLVFTPIEWIYWNGTWKFYHPSVWETVSEQN